MEDPRLTELKKQWRQDPCWDIEDTVGFEDFRDELIEFRISQEAAWEEAKLEKLKLFAKKVGLEDNLTLAGYLYYLEERIDKCDKNPSRD
jgi:hypothetical protein